MAAVDSNNQTLERKKSSGSLRELPPFRRESRPSGCVVRIARAQEPRANGRGLRVHLRRSKIPTCDMTCIGP